MKLLEMHDIDLEGNQYDRTDMVAIDLPEEGSIRPFQTTPVALHYSSVLPADTLIDESLHVPSNGMFPIVVGNTGVSYVITEVTKLGADSVALVAPVTVSDLARRAQLLAL
jgi:hypothetical protein